MKPQKILSVFLAVLFMFGCACSALAASDDTLSLTVLCSNVGGLPIPALFSSEHKVVAHAERTLGRMLNQSGADVVAVQEDFQYHALLAAQMTDYPYKTFTSGGIPAGDGLNLFSKYPICNVDRVAWTEFYGILTADNDGLTPKGFLKCTLDVNGVLIDLYNIHTDASKTMEDQLAKRAQFIQLSQYIGEHSADRPILITGDFNCTLHTYPFSDFYRTMIVEGGFSDGWAEKINGGNYLHGDDAEEIIDRYNAQYDNKFWGLWDSYERLLYRSGDGLSFDVTDFSYTFYTDKPDRPEALTDHAVMSCTVRLNTQDYARPDMTLREETDKSAAEKIVYYFRMVGRCLRLIGSDLVRLAREAFSKK
ncbi:MAG: endonuclease/exonuclease/phosphatase family protein [Clostridia bacterium]|nr:endonuclease/exonuclease/phosphatase family protein [Clostridia bacterium]